MNEIRAGKQRRRGPQGSLTIADIQIPLKRDFIVQMGGTNGKKVMRNLF